MSVSTPAKPVTPAEAQARIIAQLAQELSVRPQPSRSRDRTDR